MNLMENTVVTIDESCYIAKISRSEFINKIEYNEIHNLNN